MDVHVRDLRSFLAVARELSFTRAAKTLYISQPALSKQIRALERQLRVSLFVREPTGARLSRAGAPRTGALDPPVRVRTWVRARPSSTFVRSERDLRGPTRPAAALCGPSGRERARQVVGCSLR